MASEIQVATPNYCCFTLPRSQKMTSQSLSLLIEPTSISLTTFIWIWLLWSLQNHSTGSLTEKGCAPYKRKNDPTTPTSGAIESLGFIYYLHKISNQRQSVSRLVGQFNLGFFRVATKQGYHMTNGMDQLRTRAGKDFID